MTKPALRTIGNIVCAEDDTDYTQHIIEAGAVPCLRQLIAHNNREIQKEVRTQPRRYRPLLVGWWGAWVECEARAYFESGGQELPTIYGGFEGAEIHAFYETSQRRFETTDSDTMLDALSAAAAGAGGLAARCNWALAASS